MSKKLSQAYRWTALGLLVVRVASASEPQRIGHTALIPRHSRPDDAGMYTAQIDPVNGYAYFVGNYLFKLDITGDLPVQVGPSINCGQAAESAIDPAAGYLYLARTTLKRFALGTGTNAVSAAGALPLVAGNANCVVLDTGDPDPANHYAYVVCAASGSSPLGISRVPRSPPGLLRTSPCRRQTGPTSEASASRRLEVFSSVTRGRPTSGSDSTVWLLRNCL